MATRSPRRTARVYVPDEVLLRRFGLVRAVGGGAYLLTAAVLTAVHGIRAWPLLLGVPVLAVVTTAYFQRSSRYPRAAVALSLVADALVLGGAAAFVGGTGSGVHAAYAIVIVSAGLLLGPASAAGFTALCAGLAWLQLGSEQVGVTPLFLHRGPLDERVQVLVITTAVLVSVGYLSATYASRLHQALFESGDAAEAARARGRRRRLFVDQARLDVRVPLRAIEDAASALEGGRAALSPDERRDLAANLRVQAARLAAEVAQLADVGALDESGRHRPEPVDLPRLVEDCLREVGDRLGGYAISIDVPPLKVVGDRRAARRIVFNLLDNVADHTPPGTALRIEGRAAAGQGVLIFTDSGPGIPRDAARRLFDAREDQSSRGRVGLPLVRELAEGIGAHVRHETPRSGGARFLVGFRLAPRHTPDLERAATTTVVT